jgi:hypothetical protein
MAGPEGLDRARPSAKAGLLAAALATFLAGCGSPSGGKVFPVSIVNDTTESVVVRDCDDYCSSSPIAVTVAPGGGTVMNRIANDHKTFSITTTSGGHVGCLDLYFTAPQPGAQAFVSHAVPCTGQPRPLWQTVGLVLLLVGALALPFLMVRRGRA